MIDYIAYSLIWIRYKEKKAEKRHGRFRKKMKEISSRDFPDSKTI